MVPLVVTRQDKPRGRGLDLAFTPVKELALERGLPLFQPRTLRTPEVHEAIRAASPDLIVVVAYGRILPPEVLSVPRIMCINVHGSLLPLCRGAAPVQWTVIRGETESGVTIMAMDEGLDTGAILRQVRTPVLPDDTAGTLYDRLAALGPLVLLDVIDGLSKGGLTPIPQDHRAATMAPILTKDHGQIDWSRPSVEVANLVRGVEPWPGAFTFTAEGLRLRLFPFLRPVPCAADVAPGSIISIDREGATVRTGDGAVIVGEVQPAGGRRMAPRELAAGRRIAAGTSMKRMDLSST
jgi:methionyl-tRNA formyltransferase